MFEGLKSFESDATQEIERIKAEIAAQYGNFRDYCRAVLQYQTSLHLSA